MSPPCEVSNVTTAIVCSWCSATGGGGVASLCYFIFQSLLSFPLWYHLTVWALTWTGTHSAVEARLMRMNPASKPTLTATWAELQNVIDVADIYIYVEKYCKVTLTATWAYRIECKFVSWWLLSFCLFYLVFLSFCLIVFFSFFSGDLRCHLSRPHHGVQVVTSKDRGGQGR